MACTQKYVSYGYLIYYKSQFWDSKKRLAKMTIISSKKGIYK